MRLEHYDVGHFYPCELSPDNTLRLVKPLRCHGSIDILSAFSDIVADRGAAVSLNKVSLAWSTVDALPVANVIATEALFEIAKHFPDELKSKSRLASEVRAARVAGAEKKTRRSGNDRLPTSPRSLAKREATLLLKRMLGELAGELAGGPDDLHSDGG